MEKPEDITVSIPPFKPAGEMGYIGLNKVNGHIYEEMRSELTYPTSMLTYKKMSYDPIISASNGVIDVMIERVSWSFYCPDDAPAKVKKATVFLNHCLASLGNGGWKRFISEVGSYRIYGFYVAEKVYRQDKDGAFKGKLVWDKLATRAQSSIDKWIFSDTGRELIGLQQTTAFLTGNIPRQFAGETKITIPREKVLLFSYNTQRDNPEGQSPLRGAYIPWKYKSLIEEYEAIGVSKDLGGIPFISIDVDYLHRAQENPSSNEAAVVAQLEKDAANMHAGEKSYVILPLAYNDSGKPMFDFKLVGIDGGGKNYKTDEIIKRKQSEILMLYLADVLKLGNDGSGSFALSDNKSTLMKYAVERHLHFIIDVIQQDLVAQTLKLNGFNLSPEEMPILRYDGLEDVELEEYSKLIQRVASVGFLPRTPETVNEILASSGFDYRVSASEDFDDLFPNSTSRAGDGMKTAGEGTSLSPSGRDTSVGNNENV